MYYAFEHSGSNWNLELLVFEERGRPESPGPENLSEQRKSQQQTQNRTRPTSVEASALTTAPALLLQKWKVIY